MSLITVKGYNDSLLFIFQPGSLPEYQNYIDELAAEKPLLFKGICPNFFIAIVIFLDIFN